MSVPLLYINYYTYLRFHLIQIKQVCNTLENLLQKITLRDCFESNHVLPKQEN